MLSLPARVSVRLRPARRAGLAASLSGVGGSLWVALAVSACAYVAAFAVTSVARALYPYEIDMMEDPALQAMLRVLHGQPVFTAPTLEYMPQDYAPLYYYLSAAVAAVTGPSFLAPRLVSALASAGCMLLAYRLVRLETGRPAAGLIAAGLFAACSPIADLAMDVARVDALFVFWLLAALYVARTAPSTRGAAASGVLVGLAILTKQSGAVVAGGLLLYFALTSRARLAVCGLSLAATVGLALLALQLQNDWWRVYVWEFPRRAPIDLGQLTSFWTDDVFRWFVAPVLLGPVFLIARALRGERTTVVFHGLAALSLLGTGWAGWAHRGGAHNVLLPAYLALAILFPLGLHEATTLLSAPSRTAAVFRAYLLAVAALPFALLLYNPRLIVPYRSDGWASERLTQTVAALPGAVFAPDFGSYARAAGKGEQPHTAALKEMVGLPGVAPAPQADAWLAELGQALRERRYSYVLLEANSDAFFLMNVLKANGYVEAGWLFPEGDQFSLWQGRFTRTPVVWVPREA